MEENASVQSNYAPDCFLASNSTCLNSILGPGDNIFNDVAFETEVTVQNEDETSARDGCAQTPAGNVHDQSQAKADDDKVTVKLEEPSTSTAHISLEEMQSQVFSFETDHLALRANNEYKSVLKILVLLEAQRITAVEDLNTLEREKNAALENPATFVEKLQEGKLQFPMRQVVPEVPEVDLSKYSLATKFANNASQLTRAAGSEACASSVQTVPSNAAKSTAPSQPKQTFKPGTFNKPWTVEEQRKLEELLIKYPPQLVEAGRWKKIAEELGNRTVKQVASRVQKYFIKLTKAGLQVPGRTPHIPKPNRKVRKVQSTLKTHSYYLSTFFPQHTSTVSIEDDPVEEIPVVKKESEKLEQCSKCAKVLENAGFRFCCKDCGSMFCAEGNCQQNSNCTTDNHNVELVSKSHVDEDYIIDDHYLDPNYFPAKT